MKTQTIAHLQIRLLNSTNERQRKALETTIAAYQNPSNNTSKASAKAA